jgi:antitoxin component HigA of HigAB toxin-antitoxin module
MSFYLETDSFRLPEKESEVEKLRRAMSEAMRLLDNPPNASHRELARLNVEAWKVLRQALKDSP